MIDRANQKVSVKRSASLLILLSVALAPIARPAAAANLNEMNLAPITLSSQMTQMAVTSQPSVANLYGYGAREDLDPGWKFRLYQRLPERVWLNGTIEASERLDSNPFLSQQGSNVAVIPRITPNITAGYQLTNKVSVYGSYFGLKDGLPYRGSLAFPAMNSLSYGVRRTEQLGRHTCLQFDLQARELWQIPNLPLFDLLPGVTLSHSRGNTTLFASAIAQLRGTRYMVPTQQIDPFFTVGYAHRYGLWTVLASTTFVSNFGHHTEEALLNPTGISMISDLELNRPVSKRLPNLLSFTRLEHVYNGRSSTPQLNGSASRVYAGLRLLINKPSYYTAMNTMRKSILASDVVAKDQQTEKGNLVNTNIQTKDNNLSSKPQLTADL